MWVSVRADGLVVPNPLGMGLDELTSSVELVFVGELLFVAPSTEVLAARESFFQTFIATYPSKARTTTTPPIFNHRIPSSSVVVGGWFPRSAHHFLEECHRPSFDSKNDAWNHLLVLANFGSCVYGMCSFLFVATTITGVVPDI